MSKSEYNIVLGKLASPHPDGKVCIIVGTLHTPAQVVRICTDQMRHITGDEHWHNDPDYFAAERVRAKRKQQRA